VSSLDLDPKATALVVIDLQRGIVARDVAPHASRDVEPCHRDRLLA
jgi:nicotinamidase-related amidase